MLPDHTGANWAGSMAVIRSICEKDCEKYPETRVWRIPSRADMEVIGKCLDPTITYWISERIGEPQVGKATMAYAYRNGTFVEVNEQEYGVGYSGIGISGGSPSELSAFAKIADDIIVKMTEEDRTGKSFMKHSGTIDFHVKRIKTAMGADAAREQKIARQAALLGGQPKGTVWNCMSELVPVNMSINQVGFTCPNGEPLDLSLMQKYKWKITSTDRIKAQAENYRSDAYGMQNWNGSGVIISLMLEKQ